MPILLSLLVFIGLLLFFRGFGQESAVEENSPAERLRRLRQNATETALDEEALAQPMSERVIRPMLHGMARMLRRVVPALDLNVIAAKLDNAGIREGFMKDPEVFLGVSILVSFLTAVGTAFFLSGAEFMQSMGGSAAGIFIGGPLGAYVGFYIPSVVLSSKASGRRKKMAQQLPDFLDLLTICLAAGDGFETALLRACTQMKGPLAEEFRIVYLEVASLGKDKKEVWRDAKDRLKVESVGQFISAYLQADAVGGSVRKILTEQAALLRTRRLQAAEEAGAQAQTKMTPAIVCFFLPALMCMLLGPMLVPLFEGGLGK